ncbi:hypothetical protein PISMIDRAFT_12649 [Pisolithus microcarpus 441]|uniref:FAD-binding domain-containing protein n=1 Tax=Pisolithus microcarpus 441 TaxID=765257 RepID=A0A0C9YVR2_9AGAM|nr:hypothetical protein BKA83DRAFT_12649 [Pisolithus microcarpus]KIK20881.1 hypothetical protein PISMIDRAFT_12649 [Pisolithus microcarpus 441]
MTACTAPVLVVGAGPSGITATLMLARNNVPVRIKEKEPQHRCGRAVLISNLAHSKSSTSYVLRRSTNAQPPVLPIQEHKRGSLEPLQTFSMIDYMEPTPAIPYAIVREHLAKLGRTVELGTRLIPFSQGEKCVRAKVVKNRGGDGEEVEEDMEAAYLISADGAKGITRKQLELTFLGTTREDDFLVLRDIRLEAEGLDRAYWHIFGHMSHDLITLRPTDELGKDGWRFVVSSRTSDLEGLIRDEEALVDRIEGFVGPGDDFKVEEVTWTSEFSLANRGGILTFKIVYPGFQDNWHPVDSSNAASRKREELEYFPPGQDGRFDSLTDLAGALSDRYK